MSFKIMHITTNIYLHDLYLLNIGCTASIIYEFVHFKTTFTELSTFFSYIDNPNSLLSDNPMIEDTPPFICYHFKLETFVLVFSKPM